MKKRIIKNNHISKTAVGLCLFAFICIKSMAATGMPINTLHVKNIPDSLSMDVLRKGQLRVTYCFYCKKKDIPSPKKSRNAMQLNKLDTFLGIILKDSFEGYSYAKIAGTTSVEGTYNSNEILAHKRALTISRFFEKRYKLSSFLTVTVNQVAEDWELLEQCVQKANGIAQISPWKDEILRIIHQTPIKQGREVLLMKLGGGVPYQYMETHFFPLQRRAVITMNYDMKNVLQKQCGHELTDSIAEHIVANAFLAPTDAKRFMKDTSIGSMPVSRMQPCFLCEEFWPQPVAPADKPVACFNRTDTIYIQDTLYIEKQHAKSFPFCVIPKTNLLALGGITPEPALRAPMGNMELEFILSRKWSFSLGILYASSHSLSRYQRWAATAYTAECRYKILPVHEYSGLYVGIYGRGGDFDIQRKNTSGSTAEATVNPYNTGRYYEAGISSGYSLFIGPRWVIEAGASCGYRHKRYTPYRNVSADQYVTEHRNSNNSFKLTGLSLSIGYAIGKRK